MKSHIPEQEKTEVSLGSLYDINKQLMAQTPKIDPEILEKQKETLQHWISDRADQHYFMLLCHDLRDYTLFNVQTLPCGYISVQQVLEMANDVIECMTNRGTLQALELQEDGVWELWLNNGEGSFAYYLFPYGEAVLEY